MAAMKKGENYCIIRPDLGSVYVRLRVEGKLMCGGDFKLYLEDHKTLKEQWKMSAEGLDFSDQTVRTAPADLSQKKMVWQVVCCSTDPRDYAGSIEVIVFQNDNRCPTTAPTKKQLTNLPPCAINKFERTSGSLTFINRKE